MRVFVVTSCLAAAALTALPRQDARGQDPAGVPDAPDPPAPVPPGTEQTTPVAPTTDTQADLMRLRKELAEQKAVIEELLAAAEPAAGSADEDTFRLYGFVDMGLQRYFGTDDPLIPTRKSTFVLGNINLYFDFRPTVDWSSLVEVRFTNYPRGDESLGFPAVGVDYERTDTTVTDPGNGPGYDFLDWGAIILQRAYIQWQKLDAIGVRVGQFLTPYGIWNVDHGSPTLITMYWPKFVSNQMFPSAQIGVNVFGTFGRVLPAGWLLGYHAYVSNGRTQGAVDLTEDKMVGARLTASTMRPHPMTFGWSGMVGSYSDQGRDVVEVTGVEEEPVVDRPEFVAYREQGMGLDASVDLGALRLRSELIGRRIVYKDGAREPVFVPGFYQANRVEWDMYALAAYRIPSTRFEPYVYIDVLHWPTIVGELLITSSMGANIYFTPAVQLKLQYSMETWLADGLDSVGKHFHFLAAKLVMGL